MAIKPCRECKAAISTEAKVCPYCGATSPTGPPLSSKIAGIGCLTVIVFFVGIIAIGSMSGDNDKNAKPTVDPNTGRATLDFSKPLWAIKGSPICVSLDELEAYRRGAASRCLAVPTDWMVVQMDRNGILDPAYRVRFVGTGSDIIDGWIPLRGLRN